MQLVMRLLVNAAALWVATRVVDGISYAGEPVLLLGVALVFGVLNVALKPILTFLTFPFLLVTLGLFTFVLNAFLLWLTGAISSSLGLGFRVDGFRAAFLGGLVVSVVSLLLSFFVRSGDRDRRRDDD